MVLIVLLRLGLLVKESGGSYSARNGQYIGKYQLSASYLNGDYSAANQNVLLTVMLLHVMAHGATPRVTGLLMAGTKKPL